VQAEATTHDYSCDSRASSHSAFDIPAFGGLPNIGATRVIEVPVPLSPTFVSIRLHSWFA